MIIQKGSIENLGTELYGYNLNMVVIKTGRKHGAHFSRVQLSQKSGSSVTDSVYNKMEKKLRKVIRVDCPHNRHMHSHESTFVQFTAELRTSNISIT